VDNEPLDTARVFHSGDLNAGLTASFERNIGMEDVAAFAALSGDFNPLHVDPDYARGTNYGHPIVHGAFQVALASTMAGMYLPGRNVVVGSFQARFPAPLYAPSRVQVRGEIVRWVSSANAGMLRVTVLVPSSSTLTAEIMVSFGMHEQPSAQAAAIPQASARTRSGRPLLIVTGARGALGSELVTALADSYRILAPVRSPAVEIPGAEVEYLVCDLADQDWEPILDEAAGGDAVFGIVHAAWPGAPKGGLLDSEPEVVFRQILFGSSVTIGLANWLSRHAKDGGRLVALSSTAASLKPAGGLSAY
jgi:acyl dehydratase